MAKIAKYNREEIIKKATNLYWEKGFQGTSMRNLQDVIDMRPGSIYATFGSKEGLYKEALQYYSNSGRLLLETFYQKTHSPLGALKMFLKNALITNADSAPSNMCMLSKTVSELTEENNELLLLAKHLLKDIESRFADMLVKAQECGELDKEKDTAALACFIQVQFMGLRTYGRVNEDKANMNALVDELFDRVIA